MLELFLSCLFLLVSLYGFGSLVCRIFSIRLQHHEQIIAGLYLISQIALFAHFFMPMGMPQSLSILGFGFGWGAFRIYQDDLWSWVKNHRLNTILLFGLLFLICGYGLSKNLYSDVTAYHLPTLMKIQESKLILGLANLQDRFGYNSLFHLGSVVTNPFLRVESSNDLQSIILLFLFLVSPFFMQGFSRHCAMVVRFCAVFIWGGLTFLISVGLPATDLSSGIFAIFILEKLMSCLISKEVKLQDYVFLSLLFLFATQVKLSQLFLIFPILGVFYQLRYFPPILARHLFVFALLTVPWFVRTFLISGCWVFPVSMTCLPSVSWALPLREVLDIKAIIQSWARVPLVPTAQVGPFLEWFPLWFARQWERPFFISWCLTASVFLLSFVILCLKKRKNLFEQNGDFQQTIILVPLLIPVFALWFWQAPDLRFLYGPFLFTQGYFLVMIFCWCLNLNVVKKIGKYLLILICLIYLQDFSRIAIGELLYQPLLIQRFKPDEKPPLVRQISQNQVEYFVPDLVLGGDESGCWLQAGLCANIPRPLLFVRTWHGYTVMESRP